MRAPRSLRFLIVLFLWALPARAGSVDPLLRMLQKDVSPGAPGRGVAGLVYERLIGMDQLGPNGGTRAGVILRLDGDLPDLSAVPGIEIGSVIGGFATARVPVSSLDALEAVPGIRHIQAARMSYPALDIGVPAANVPQVWNGTPSFTGDGVLVGVIDSGIDWTHDDFRNTNGTTRIKAIYDLFGTGGTPPAGFTGGVEYTESQINAALTGGGTVGEVDINGHGTHVTGIASGNGRASGGLYTGVAFEANIVFAKAFDDMSGGFPEDKTIDAMNYLVQKAGALGRPIAINMSLGGQFGPHDGTTAQEVLVDNLSGTGKVFVIAAGNEGGDFIHGSASASNGTIVYRVVEYTPNQGMGNDVFLIDMWVDAPASVRITGPNGGTSGTVASGGVFNQNTTAGGIIVDNTFQAPNGDREIIIQVSDQGGTNPVAGDWQIVFTGGSGTAHAWQVVASMVAGFPGTDNTFSLGMPATAEKAVTVAALKTRNNWPAEAGNVGYSGDFGAAPIGGNAPFSSKGPTRDGRQKPDVISPGMAIISCLSKDVNPPEPPELKIAGHGGKYFASQGTSQASPLTCGIVALMLEKNPALTADQIRTTLRNTAVADAFTGAVWNSTYGAGKVSAQAAVAAVTGGGATATGDIDLDGSASVLDVVKLVIHILNPVANPLTTDQRTRADVFPPGAPDGILNVQDVSRIVAFILKTAVPAAPAVVTGPATFFMGTPEPAAGGGWTLPIRLEGEAVAGAQFAVRLPGADWDAGRVESNLPAGFSVRAEASGDLLKVILYAIGREMPADGGALHIPFRIRNGEAAEPVLSGLLVADQGGFAREVQVHAGRLNLPPIRFFEAFPNPTRGPVTISYQLGAGRDVRLAVFDVGGREVRRLDQGPKPAGKHDIDWDGRDDRGRPVPAGLYFYRLSTADQNETKKIVVRN